MTDVVTEESEETTVGAEAVKLLSNPDEKQLVKDTSNEMIKDYMDNLESCVRRYKDWTDPFYVVVLNRRERLLVNVIRNMFFARKTLPTPEYDQTVYYYDPKTDELRYLWTVPDKETVMDMVLCPNEVRSSHFQLLEFCQLFVQGKLDIKYGYPKSK